MQKCLRYGLLICILCVVAEEAMAQKQLLLLKKEKVLLRLYPGDEFIFKLKGSKTIRKSYVNNLFDTAVVAHKDMIPYHRIDRVYFNRRNLLNVVGGLLVIGGVGYFIIDQVNVVLVHGEEADIDGQVATASAIMVAAGLPLILTKKKYARVGGKYRLLMVDKGSGFYMPDMRQDADQY
jgi:hypothetical protein